MTDPTAPLQMPSDPPADCAACTPANGSPPAEQRASAAGDRREEGHEAAAAGANRAQDTKSPVSEAAHRPARRPSPTLGPIDHFPHQACTRSQAHHRNPPTSIPSSPTPSSNASSSSLPLTDEPCLQPHMLPDHLLRVLQCPLCPPASLLRAPVTLHCGHTFCASHFAPRNVPSTSKPPESASTLPQCRLPICSPSPCSLTTFSHTPPTDVTTNKLLGLLDRASREGIQPDPFPPHFSDDHDDHTDSERELESDPELEYLPILPQSPSSGSSSSPTRDSADPSTASGSSSPRRPRSPEASPSLHPRKRRRRLRLPPASSQSHAQPHHRNDHDRYTSDRLEKELLTELSCEICFGLFWQPITTPCQHTFCKRCLFRSLDHSQTCPLCRQKLPGYDYFQQQPCNKVILAIILRAFPDAYAERGQMVEAEERDVRLDTPILICQLGFPGMPTFLHFFEPRYRLMLRRCLESPNPCFGMIPPPRAAPSTSANGTTSTGNDYGIMLQIRNVQTFPDGRSIVETWGSWRFRIMERGMRDGYMLARIERVEDYQDELDHSAFAPADEEVDGEPRTTVSNSASSLEGSVGMDSAAGTGRVGHRLEAAVRAGIGDVVVDMHSLSPEPSSHSATSSAPLEPCSDAGAGAIPTSPLSLSGVAADDRDHVRSDRAVLSAGARQMNGKAPASRRPPTNAELMAKCHAFIEQTRQGTPWVVQQLNNNNFIPMPTDPAAFSFWMALALPIDEHEKAKLLPIRSPRLRLRLVVHWIEQLNSQWTRAYASATPLQVVLWRLRYYMMLPRAVRGWAMLFAYAALLSAVYLGQSVTHRAGASAGRLGHGMSEDGEL
ncbi:hypothetical protein LXA43DRAFT_53207 [Ganoderma leucocontextum]|nr:hypothetical protein LXA43DRAFT_53207 [Ganoderma leucocontextum]